MSQDNVDWQLEPIPPDNAPYEPTVRAASPHRWGWLIVVLLAVTALGGWGFIRLGEARLREQLQHEIRYEDTQSRTGQINLVLAVHEADDAGWLEQRASEVAANLPAPLPAPQLVPLDQPAQVLQVRPLADHLYDVQVRRTYADAAGLTYAFDLWQRYRNLGPGIWKRVPPDEGVLLDLRHWTGQRLTVVAPAADWALLEPLLLAVDETLQRACADWLCPADLILSLGFSGQRVDLPVSTPTVHPISGAAEPYPLAFDVALNMGRAAPELVLTTPRLTGLPADALATDAYHQALTLRVLLHLAGQLGGHPARTVDLFRDALVAREAQRLGLGLGSLPRAAISPAQYQSLQNLWETTRRVEDNPYELEVAYRLQALAFLEQTLADQTAQADAELLRTRYTERQLVGWLAGATDLGMVAAAERVTGWHTQAQQTFTRNWPADLHTLGGLTLACGDGLWLIRKGQVVPLLPAGLLAAWPFGALSPDGRQLVLTHQIDENHSELRLITLATGEVEAVPTGGGLRLLGWSAHDEVLYLQLPNGDAPFPFAMLALWRWGPGGVPEPMMSGTFFSPPDVDQIWSRARTQLALTEFNVRDGQQLLPSLSLLTPVRGYVQSRFAPGTRAGVYAPDSRHLAYLRDILDAQGRFVGATIELLSTGQGGTTRTLLEPVALALSPDVLSYLQTLVWSPDSTRLAFVAHQTAADPRLAPGRTTLYWIGLADGALQVLMTLPESGYVSPLLFSADSRYLAYGTYSAQGDAPQISLIDFEFAQSQRYEAHGAAWSPDGHRLALLNSAGVYVVDPATGALAWVKTGTCSQAAWYPL